MSAVAEYWQLILPCWIPAAAAAAAAEQMLLVQC